MNWSNACNQGFVFGVSKMVTIACHFWFGLHIDDDLVVRLFQWAYDKSDTGLSLSIWSRAPGHTLCRTMFGPHFTIPNSSVQWNQVFGCLELFLGYRWSSSSSRFWLMLWLCLTPISGSFPMKMAIARWGFNHILSYVQAPKTAPKTIHPPVSVTKSTCMRLQRLQPSGDEFPICSKSVPGANLELPNELEMERTAECSYPVKIVCR